MAEKERLFDQFPPVATKEWMERINIDLKGADFQKKLVWKTNEGIQVNPFYRAENVEGLMYSNTLPGRFPFIRGTKTSGNSWLVRQNIKVTDYAEANLKALDILMKGIDSLGFTICNPGTLNDDTLEILLKGIDITAVEINFLSEGKAEELIRLLESHVMRTGVDPLLIRGAFEADPLSRLMLNGTLCIPPEDGFDYLASLIHSSEIFPYFRAIHLNASNFNNAGAGLIQELAYALAMGNEYLAQLTLRGISVDVAASKIRFSFGIRSEYFPEIARLRAARLLWSVVTNGYKPENVNKIKMNIHCVTSRWNKTLYDPYVNLLRTQTEAMSAILGGADSLTTEPFDIVFRDPGEFSERIARNQQLILKEEAYFDKVADPAAGSYYIENLTSLIAEKAWKLFLEVEDNGGFLACLKSGFIQNKIKEAGNKQKADIASRKVTLLGTNQYPNTLEKISDSVKTEIAFYSRSYGKELVVEPIILSRGAEQYERMRLAVDKAPQRPVVFLLAIGDHIKRKARSQFAANLFGCAGYRIIDNPGFESTGEAINQALEAKADIVVVCSSDEEYLQYVPGIYRALKNDSIVVVAGNPVSNKDLQTIGIEYFIHTGCNVTGMLYKFNSLLGINV